MFLGKKDRPSRRGTNKRSFFVFLFLFLKEVRRGGKDVALASSADPEEKTE